MHNVWKVAAGCGQSQARKWQSTNKVEQKICNRLAAEISRGKQRIQEARIAKKKMHEQEKQATSKR